MNQSNDVDIVLFAPEWSGAFRRLNEEWIERYFEIEEDDRRMLGDPQGEIIDAGGMVFVALMNGEAVGICAMVRLVEGVYELSKMGVTETAQGKGLGKRLMKASIDWAKAQGAREITLETNSVLKTAIALYRRFGFVDIKVSRSDSHYKRADTWMRLEL